MFVNTTEIEESCIPPMPCMEYRWIQIISIFINTILIFLRCYVFRRFGSDLFKFLLSTCKNLDISRIFPEMPKFVWERDKWFWYLLYPPPLKQKIKTIFHRKVTCVYVGAGGGVSTDLHLVPFTSRYLIHEPIFFDTFFDMHIYLNVYLNI